MRANANYSMPRLGGFAVLKGKDGAGGKLFDESWSCQESCTLQLVR
ncbi:MAG: hypothetical protein HYR60_00585 [Acidobacteria bacterium]|nr:hypothetical protein [Acidobacteriota bacterium]